MAMSIASLIWGLIDSYVFVAVAILAVLNALPSIGAAGKEQRKRFYHHRPLD